MIRAVPSVSESPDDQHRHQNDRTAKGKQLSRAPPEGACSASKSPPDYPGKARTEYTGADSGVKHRQENIDQDEKKERDTERLLQPAGHQAALR